MNELFEENQEDGWGVLIMDAENAFNSLNINAVLWNIVYYGLDVQDSSSIHIEDGQLWWFVGLNHSCTTKKESHKGIHYQCSCLQLALGH